MENNHSQNGVGLIAAERDRQISKLGYDADHDDAHENGDILDASVCYAEAVQAGVGQDSYAPTDVPVHWPWSHDEWKPSEHPVRNLVKAGALLAAEIDRYHREFREKCNEVAERLIGFEVFDDMDAYDLDKLDWIGVDPESFIREHFAEDIQREEYEADLRRQSDEYDAAGEEDDDGQ